MSYIYSERKEEIRQVHNADKTISEECINNIIIGRITEAPEHHRDNEFIHSGYRINFNSSKHVLKSLFMIHNESVNIWSHLLGAGLIIILVAYTSIYYQSHKAEIYDILEHKWDGLNDRWKEFSIYLVDKMPSYENFRSDLQIKLKEGQSTFNDYASSFKNKTVHYFNAVDDTLNEYKDYIKAKFHCIECVQELIAKLTRMKDNLKGNFEEVKDKIKTIYKNNAPDLEQYEQNIKNYMEEVNLKVHQFTEDLMDHIKSQEFNWVNFTRDESDPLKYISLPKWPIFTFLLSAVVCLTFSSVYHWLFVKSEKWSQFLARLDYAGISLLIAGSCYPPYYYLFYCSPRIMITYISFISLFGFIIFLYSFKEDFNSPSNRSLRGFLFLIFGVSSAIPILHLVFFKETIDGVVASPTLLNWVLGGLCYIFGCLIYINRFPERKWPGKFCIWGSSHQIWHFLVLSGIIFHFLGSLDSYNDRLNNFCSV